MAKFTKPHWGTTQAHISNSNNLEWSGLLTIDQMANTYSNKTNILD